MEPHLYEWNCCFRYRDPCARRKLGTTGSPEPCRDGMESVSAQAAIGRNDGRFGHMHTARTMELALPLLPVARLLPSAAVLVVPAPLAPRITSSTGRYLGTRRDSSRKGIQAAQALPVDGSRPRTDCAKYCMYASKLTKRAPSWVKKHPLSTNCGARSILKQSCFV
jgi:hypothetical protein